MIGQQLIELIGQATEADLGELRSQISELQKRLDALRSIEKVLQARLGKTNPARLDAAPGFAGDGLLGERRRQIAMHLSKHGPTTLKTLCEKFGIPDGSITLVTTYQWFEKTTKDRCSPIVLTAAGRAAIPSIGGNSPTPAATG